MKITIPPEAAGTVEALSQIGYSPHSAICDIIDNSIQAGANYIEVSTNPAEGWLEIRDNGSGMDNDEVREALIYGKRTKSSTSLGKFGIGLKTAATGLGRKVSVYSAKYNKEKEVPELTGTFILDTEHIKKENKWEAIRQETEPEVRKRFIRKHNNINTALEKIDPSYPKTECSGTVIRIEKLKNILGKEFQDRTGKPFHKAVKTFKDDLREHIGRVYANFLKGDANNKIFIEVDGKLADPISPLETAELIKELSFPVTGLKHSEELVAKIYKCHEETGVYLYREGRLIEFGRIMYGLKRDSRLVLVFDYSQNLDNIFPVDVQKSKVDPKLDSDIIDEITSFIKNARRLSPPPEIEVKPTAAPPTIKTRVIEAVIGEPISHKIEVTENPTKVDWEAEETPEGLFLDTDKGIVGGLPTKAGTYEVTAVAQNELGVTKEKLTIIVKEENNPVEDEDTTEIEPPVIGGEAKTEIVTPVSIEKRKANPNKVTKDDCIELLQSMEESKLEKAYNLLKSLV